MNNGLFYRYKDVTYAAHLNEFDEPMGNSELKLICEEYIVEKRTEKSVLLRPWYGGLKGNETKWMRLKAHKVFAAPTKTEALKHFIKRKERQASIYKARLESAQEAKRKAENLLDNPSTIIPQ